VHAALRAVPGTPLDRSGWPAPPRSARPGRLSTA